MPVLRGDRTVNERRPAPREATGEMYDGTQGRLDGDPFICTVRFDTPTETLKAQALTEFRNVGLQSG
jgi:hypothetical protein